ncbi:MAG: hypothetical protein EB084_14045 [Proteobacteria bacterium]|nr:hypothetical protein [Pseudomonadota bacterium]
MRCVPGPLRLHSDRQDFQAQDETGLVVNQNRLLAALLLLLTMMLIGENVLLVSTNNRVQQLRTELTRLQTQVAALQVNGTNQAQMMSFMRSAVQQGESSDGTATRRSVLAAALFAARYATLAGERFGTLDAAQRARMKSVLKSHVDGIRALEDRRRSVDAIWESAVAVVFNDKQRAWLQRNDDLVQAKGAEILRASMGMTDSETEARVVELLDDRVSDAEAQH